MILVPCDSLQVRYGIFTLYLANRQSFTWSIELLPILNMQIMYIPWYYSLSCILLWTWKIWMPPTRRSRWNCFCHSFLSLLFGLRKMMRDWSSYWFELNICWSSSLCLHRRLMPVGMWVACVSILLVKSDDWLRSSSGEEQEHCFLNKCSLIGICF
jgi:hypothetical protein